MDEKQWTEFKGKKGSTQVEEKIFQAGMETLYRKQELEQYQFPDSGNPYHDAQKLLSALEKTDELMHVSVWSQHDKVLITNMRTMLKEKLHSIIETIE